MPKLLALCVMVVLLSCKSPSPPTVKAALAGAEAAEASAGAARASMAVDAGDADAGSSGASITVTNDTARAATVTIIFGGGTVVTGWPFCAPRDAGATCSFVLDGKASKGLPLGGEYLNATLVFDGYRDGTLCGSTKAEFNVNNPKWYDILDISLVDGFSDKIEMIAIEPGGTSMRLGPPIGREGNEKVFGVYPYGCDICVERQPPMACGIPAGKAGCKSGSQYNPDVPCQYQGTVKGGGTAALVRLL
jgi:hypothetical protein